MDETRHAPAYAAAPIVKELADSHNMQAKYMNRVWLLTFALSIVLLPRLLFGSGYGDFLQVPLFGEIDSRILRLMTLIMFPSLCIAFCVSYASTSHAWRFAHDSIDSLFGRSRHTIQRRLYDVMTIGSLTRIGPVAAHDWLIRSTKEWFPWIYGTLSGLILSLFILFPLLTVAGAAWSYFSDDTAEAWSLWIGYSVGLFLTTLSIAAIFRVIVIEAGNVRRRIIALKRTSDLKQPDALESWIESALVACDGRASPIDIARKIWFDHEGDLKESGEMLYTWQTDLRAAASRLRKAGKITYSRRKGERTEWELSGN